VVSLIARLLGWFSAGLGIVQLVAPRTLLTAIGIVPTGVSVAVTRLIGLRELSAMPGLLAVKRPFGWLAARVAGDVMDLALLAVAHADPRNHRGRIRTAVAAVAGILAVDVVSGLAARREAQRRSRHGDRIVQAVTVNRPPDELYRFWRDLENLPRVMPHLESVEARGGTTSHWVARGPMGTRVEWDAEITEDLPNRAVAWRSIEGSQVENAGSVRFASAPGDRGTEVIVEMSYSPPGGPIGSVVAAVTGEEPRQQVSDALRRFKQVMETGEPLVSDATATGHKVMQRPAQPLEEARS
jgi:uncharacterized membrane protein